MKYFLKEGDSEVHNKEQTNKKNYKQANESMPGLFTESHTVQPIFRGYKMTCDV